MTDKIDASVRAAERDLRGSIDRAEKGKNPTKYQDRSLGKILMDIEVFDPAIPLKSTYGALDSTLHGGFHYGCMYVVAGMTGEGKSTFVQNLSMRVANSGNRVTLFTLEDPVNHVVRKLVSMTAGVSIKKVTNEHAPSEDESKRIEDAKKMLPSLPLRIEGNSDRLDTVLFDIRAEWEIGVRIFVVDQSSCIEVPEAKMEYEMHMKMSKAFKAISKELKIILIVVSQVNRSGSKRKAEGGSVGMDDIRSSGTWAHDSGGVIVIKDVGTEYDVVEMKLQVTKHRFGFNRKEFSLAFNRPWQRIDDWTEADERKKPAEVSGRVSSEQIAALLIDKNAVKSQPQTLEMVLMSASGIREINDAKIKMFLNAVKSNKIEQHCALNGIYALQNSGGMRAKWYFGTDLAALKANYNH